MTHEALVSGAGLAHPSCNLDPRVDQAMNLAAPELDWLTTTLATTALSPDGATCCCKAGSARA